MIWLESGRGRLIEKTSAVARAGGGHGGYAY
jgi:hypothetical protein